MLIKNGLFHFWVNYWNLESIKSHNGRNAFVVYDLQNSMVNSWNVCLPKGCTIKVNTQRAFCPIKWKMDCPSFIYFFGEEIFINFYSLDHKPLLVKGFPSFIFLLAFCWLNQSFAIATINIKVEVGSIPFKHLISKAELDCAMQVTLCQSVSPHSVKLTKTCDSVFFQYRSCQFLLKPSLYILFCPLEALSIWKPVLGLYDKQP